MNIYVHSKNIKICIIKNPQIQHSGSLSGCKERNGKEKGGVNKLWYIYLHSN